MLTSGNQLKAARALIGMEQAQLAELAGLNVNTVRNMEAVGSGPIAGRAQNVQLIQATLEAAGVEFTNGGHPGVKLVLSVSEARVSDDSYEFACRYAGSEFVVLAPTAALDRFEKSHDPKQPAEGRLRRAAWYAAARIHRAWKMGRRPDAGILRLTVEDFAK